MCGSPGNLRLIKILTNKIKIFNQRSNSVEERKDRGWT